MASLMSLLPKLVLPLWLDLAVSLTCGSALGASGSLGGSTRGCRVVVGDVSCWLVHAGGGRVGAA